MRIALVAPLVSAIREPQQGGSQAFVADLGRGLVGRGHDVHLHAASGSEVTGVELIDTGVDPRDLAATLFRADAAPEGTDAAAAAFAKVYATVGATHYDLVHNHAFDLAAITLASDLPAPVVHTLHLPPDPTLAGALRDAAEGDRHPTVACVSDSHAGAWRRLVRVDAVLPSYVPTGLIPFSPAGGDGAVFAGRFSPEKGAAEAIEIARAAGIPIDVFGNSYDPDYVREQIDPVRAAPGVSVHPALPRGALWAAMGRATVVVCPARWDEPFGMVAAEAQACGTPVVAFRRGALGEVVVDGVTGYVVAPGDIAAAADAVRRAPELARARCRQHAESRLDLALSIDAHERVYERVATAGLGARASG